ncbi:MAG: MerR family transcriptional regulator [Firmicutes bacterium]|nr:MerR family transcriptional regulator [Bacillota bacterium]
MYTMKQVCEMTGMTYEGLKYYCNQGLVPYVKRDENNRRVFDDADVLWINHLGYIRRCRMGIKELRDFVALCLEGESTVAKRKSIIQKKRGELAAQIALLQKNLEYADREIAFYDKVLSGEIEYKSGLVPQNR